MPIRRALLAATALLAALTSADTSAEAPDNSVLRAARHWNNASWVQRAQTGHVGCKATNGCEHKPICSVCDYSVDRHCDCEQDSFLDSFAAWFSVGGSDCCETQCSAQKSVSQKTPVQKSAPQKCVQKCAPQKCVQKCAPCVQKCAPVKCAPQKCVQKCAPKKSVQKGSCGCAPRTSMFDSIKHQFGLLGGCSCISKCGCEPKVAKSKGGKSCGADGPAVTLPVPMYDPGMHSPPGMHSAPGMQLDETPEPVDPAVPPAPMLQGNGRVGTGVRNADRANMDRPARVPSSMPRLLPSESSAQDVSRISYEELIHPSHGVAGADSARRLDVFQAVSKLEKRMTAARSETSGVRRNPLR